MIFRRDFRAVHRPVRRRLWARRRRTTTRSRRGSLMGMGASCELPLTGSPRIMPGLSKDFWQLTVLERSVHVLNDSRRQKRRLARRDAEITAVFRLRRRFPRAPLG